MVKNQNSKINQSITINIHKPDKKEYFFYLISGIAISVPFTIFYETFADQLCILLPLVATQICSTAIFASFIEELAKAYLYFIGMGKHNTQY